MSKQAFIRENRAELEKAIRNVLEGRKPAHYIKYDLEHYRMYGPQNGGSFENPEDDGGAGLGLFIVYMSIASALGYVVYKKYQESQPAAT